MHTIEPFYNWLSIYNSSEDELSPFYGREYSCFELSNTIYNYYIHPLWDDFSSSTLYLKILFVDYSAGYSIIELFGEWNDCLYNDIMFLKREVIDSLLAQQINKFILIGEHVFNFHYSDEEYYNEWHEDIENGWIFGINFRQHVVSEFKNCMIHKYIHFTPTDKTIFWRKHDPNHLFVMFESLIIKRIHSNH
jgi:hypothetical protein